MNKFAINLGLILLLSVNSLYANPAPEMVEDSLPRMRSLIQEILNDNTQYQDKFHDAVSAESLKQQTPSTTAVLCSDSRVDLTAIIDDPVNNVFVIRNIGNQVKTAYGSVEYGVDILKSHLLLIIGHSECGAVKAAMKDYSSVPKNIRKELDYMSVHAKDSLNDNIVHNINNQVKLAVADFGPKVESGEVVVVGMVYDLHNDFKQGHGALIIVDVNNETDPKLLLKNKYLKDLKNLKVLTQ